jgi:hypothetical protein
MITIIIRIINIIKLALGIEKTIKIKITAYIKYSTYK